MAKYRFYAVARGHNVGLYSNWTECQMQVNGFKSAKFKGFNSRGDAKRFIEANKIILEQSIGGIMKAEERTDTKLECQIFRFGKQKKNHYKIFNTKNSLKKDYVEQVEKVKRVEMKYNQERNINVKYANELANYKIQLNSLQKRYVEQQEKLEKVEMEYHQEREINAKYFHIFQNQKQKIENISKEIDTNKTNNLNQVSRRSVADSSTQTVDFGRIKKIKNKWFGRHSLTNAANLYESKQLNMNDGEANLEKNNQGGFNVKINGHTYHLNSRSEKSVLWRCTKMHQLKCKSYATTDIDITKVIKSSPHNHSPIEKPTKREKGYKNCKKAEIMFPQKPKEAVLHKQEGYENCTEVKIMCTQTPKEVNFDLQKRYPNRTKEKIICAQNPEAIHFKIIQKSFC